LTDISSFKSGKEIELGIDSSNVIKIFGQPTKRSNIDGLDVFIYEVKDPIDYPEEKIEYDNIEFFNYFKTHLYYGNYKFRNGKLIEFYFGFPYP
jgi:hypothetical protein